MANFDSSPKSTGNPLSEFYTEVTLLSGVQFGTGAINTAVVWDIYDYDKRLLYIDITGACTGGVSAPVTIAITSKPSIGGAWTTLHSYSVTNTAYMYSLNPSGVALSGLWQPLANIKAVVTNPNTGTGGGAVNASAVTASISIKLSLKK